MNEKRFCFCTSPVALSSNIIKGDKYRFTVLSDALLRLEYDEDGVFEDRASQTVFFRDMPETEHTNYISAGTVKIETSKLILEYVENEPFSESTLIIKLKEEPASCWRYGEDFEDLGGTVATLDTVVGEIPLGRGVCSRYGFSLIDDSESMLLNDEGWVECRKKGSKDLYFFGYGYDYLSAVKAFYKLTGAPPMLPSYAFGNWWSRYHKYSDKEYTELIERFKAEDAPFSVGVIDMDWHLVDIPKELKALNSERLGWTGFTWNKELFPDHKAFLKKLHENGLKTALNLHPSDGVRRHEEQYEKMALACGKSAESGEPVYFDILSEKFMSNYFDVLLHPYEDDGVDFWWIDWQQGGNYGWIHEPNKDGVMKDEREVLDPLWMLNHLHTADISRDGKRPMLFSRYGGPGSHRYSIGFSGDTVTCWDALRFQPYFTATASNVGYCRWSHDIGGHMHGYRDDELMARWLQLGVFSPINRLHSTSNEFQRKEPWCYGDDVSGIIKSWLRLRHRLLPYLYTMNRRTHERLIPMILPMYYGYPKNSAAYEVKNQFFFGTELFAAPITSPTSKITKMGEVPVWLPRGEWFDFFNGTRYVSEKGRMITMCRPLSSFPVMAKQGAIVPTSVFKPHENRLFNSDEMEVFVFPGNSNVFEMYEDKGDGNDNENGAFAITKFELQWNDNPRFIIHGAKGETSLIPKKRKWKISLRGFDKSINVDVLADNIPIEYRAYYSDETHTVNIVFSADTDTRCDLLIGGNKLVHENEDAMVKCFDIIQKSQIGISVKNDIFRTINDGRFTIHQKIMRISALSIEEQSLSNALKELLTLFKGEFNE